MAIPIASILKNLGPIVASAVEAARLIGGMRKSPGNLKNEERIRELEEEVARIADVTARLAEQTQAIAEQLRLQDAVNAAQEKRMKLCLVVSITALCVAIGALITTLVR